MSTNRTYQETESEVNLKVMSQEEYEPIILDKDTLHHLKFFFNSIPISQLDKYDVVNWAIEEDKILISYYHPSYGSEMIIKANNKLGINRKTQVQTIKKIINNAEDLSLNFSSDINLNLVCNSNEKYVVPYLNDDFINNLSGVSRDSLGTNIGPVIRYLEGAKNYFGNLIGGNDRIMWNIQGKDTWIYMNVFDKVGIFHQETEIDIGSRIHISLSLEQVEIIRRLVDLPDIRFNYHESESIITACNDYIDFCMEIHRENEDNFLQLQSLTGDTSDEWFRIHNAEFTQSLQKINHILSKFDNHIDLIINDKDLLLKAYSPLSGHININLECDSSKGNWSLRCQLKNIINFSRKFDRNQFLTIHYLRDKSVLKFNAENLTYLFLIG